VQQLQDSLLSSKHKAHDALAVNDVAVLYMRRLSSLFMFMLSGVYDVVLVNAVVEVHAVAGEHEIAAVFVLLQ
jgi:hypothetical protein